MEEELEQKQTYLRNEIIEKGYDPEMFTKYIISIKGEDGFDLENWSMNELMDIVRDFKLDYEEAKRQGLIKEDPIPDQNEEEKTITKQTQSQQNTSIHSSPTTKQTMQQNQQTQPRTQSKTSTQQQQKPKPSSNAKQPFFSQKSNSSQEIKTKEIDGFVQINITDFPENSDKNIMDNNNKNGLIIPTTTDLFNPLKEYNESIVCNKVEKTPLTQLSKAIIVIKNPEMIKSGLFSFAFLQFTIETKELNCIVVRRLADFEWFYSKMNELFPGVAIPAFPLKKFFEKSTETEIQKKMMYAQKFINALIKIKIIRSSKLFYNFISLTKDEWKNYHLTLDKKQTLMLLKQFSTVEGLIQIKITKELDDNASLIQKQNLLRSSLHKRLTNAYNNVLSQMNIMSDALLELSNTYKDLSQTYNECIFKNDSIYSAYHKMDNLFNVWSKGYKKQCDFFKYELRYFFKYIHKEIDCFTTLIDEYKNSKAKYFDQSIKLSKLPFVNSVQQSELISLKHYYGYFMNQMINEYNRLDHNHAKRMKHHFETLTERKQEFITDHMSFIQLVNFNY